jgi:hypothetical protein
METKQRLEELRKEAIDNPGKKKRGCSSCKKKKVEVNELPQLLVDETYIPTQQEIVLAYEELTSYGGVKEDKKEIINKVYMFLFGEEFLFNCGGCASNQANKFGNYIKSL